MDAPDHGGQNDGWLRVLPSPDIVLLVRGFYLLSAAAIVGVRLLSPLRDRFLDYGPRSNPPQGSGASQRPSPVSSRVSSPLSNALDFLVTLRVPHSRFSLFYVVSIFLSVFWLCDLVFDGPCVSVLYQFLPRGMRVSPAVGSSSRPVLSMVLMALHSMRRWYENSCVTVSNPNSTMWIGHFGIGVAFYVFVHLAILVEHIPTLRPGLNQSSIRLPKVASPTDPWARVAVAVATVVFLLASLWQHRYHSHLASLRKYTLPTSFGASHIIAPHYTAECLLYLSLAILGAPPTTSQSSHGQTVSAGLVNRTMLCVLVFVVVNLGVTADGTKSWMLAKFKDHQREVERRWRMIPGLW